MKLEEAAAQILMSRSLELSTLTLGAGSRDSIPTRATVQRAPLHPVIFWAIREVDIHFQETDSQ